jgi:polyisoprenoid-binding protein YceI
MIEVVPTPPLADAQWRPRSMDDLGWVARTAFTLALLCGTRFASGETYRIAPDASELVVRTDRAGFPSMVGHRHRIEVTEFEGSVRFDPADLRTAALEV